MTESPALSDQAPTVDELMSHLRGVQLYMIRMDMTQPVASPFDYLAPHLREHILWLVQQEADGVLFLSGANADGADWDGSGTAIVRAASREDAVRISDSEPFYREGLRTNTVHGWTLNEGTLRLSLNLFADHFEIN